MSKIDADNSAIRSLAALPVICIDRPLHDLLPTSRLTPGESLQELLDAFLLVEANAGGVAAAMAPPSSPEFAKAVRRDLQVLTERFSKAAEYFSRGAGVLADLAQQGNVGR